MKISNVEEIYDNVIHKKLIQMAINDELPMNMGHLNFGYFENEVKDYLNKIENELAYKKADEFLYLDGVTPQEAVEHIVSSNAKDSDMLDYNLPEGVFPLEKFEYTFTVKSFLETIGYNTLKA